MRTLLVLVVLVHLTACYYTQAVRGQLEMMAKRTPIERVIEETGDAALRERLTAVLEIRAFASRELGLPDNRSYRSYADLGRPYAVWNVVAAGEFSVDPVTWCFPVAGCVAYRGYFNEAAARRFAGRLSDQGYDVTVEGVAAYSTLGRFADPVLNTMIGGDEVRLAALIFHELAHQRVYVKGDTAFNEAFATVVEEAGVRRWLEDRGRQDRLESYLASQARHAQFTDLLRGTRERLRDLYASDLPEHVMRERKAAGFDALRARYRALRDGEWSGWRGYDAFFDRELNNAHLVSVATYHDRVPGLRARLAACDDDLGCFYAAVTDR